MPSAPEHDVILIVDDNPTNLEVLFEMFKGSGFKVLVAVDGQSAIDQAEYAQPDMILLDVMMPEVDGFEACRRLKQIDSLKEIPIIFREEYMYRFLGKVQVKGKTKTAAVFEVFNGQPPSLVSLKNQTKPDFEEALAYYYDRNFVEAGRIIEQVLAKNPLDKAAILYKERIALHIVQGVAPGWTGVEELTEK